MTQAEAHPIELPNRQPGRAAKIAAIHMFADWLVAHPEVPVPRWITAYYHLSPLEEVDEATRYSVIELLSERLGVPMYGTQEGTDRPRQFNYRVADNSVHGVLIDYYGSWSSDAAYGRAL